LVINPNPQSPIPNPQSPIPNLKSNNHFKYLILYIIFKNLKILLILIFNQK